MKPGTIHAVGLGPDTRIVVVGFVPGAEHPTEETLAEGAAQVRLALAEAGIVAAVVELPPGLVPHASTRQSQELARVAEELLRIVAPLERARDARVACRWCGSYGRKHQSGCRLHGALERARALGLGEQ